MEPTETDVWTIYRKGLIDSEGRDKLLSLFREEGKIKERNRKKLMDRWRTPWQKQID